MIQAARIDDVVLAHMREFGVPGISVAIAQGGVTAMAKGYGLANVELSVPATADSVYQIASITKTFTATAVMLLIEEGKLGLDDPIVDHISDLPEAWREVTISHLLNHTSGIKSFTSIEIPEKTRRSDAIPREQIDLVANEPMDFAPGEKWSYNNTGYILLGMLIEQIAGEKYGDFLARRIFRQLGMTNTRMNDLRAIVANRVSGYAWDGESLKNGEYVSPSQPHAAGGLVSSVNDLTKWLPETVLSESMLDRMWNPTTLSSGETADYGFGWELGTLEGRRFVAHNGGIPGFATRYARFPEARLVVVVLTNEQSHDVRKLTDSVAALALKD